MNYRQPLHNHIKPLSPLLSSPLLSSPLLSHLLTMISMTPLPYLPTHSPHSTPVRQLPLWRGKAPPVRQASMCSNPPVPLASLWRGHIGLHCLCGCTQAHGKYCDSFREGLYSTAKQPKKMNKESYLKGTVYLCTLLCVLFTLVSLVSCKKGIYCCLFSIFSAI